MNLFALPPGPLAEERSEILARGGNVRVERIVSTGQTTDWYDQEETEFVSVLQGEATLEFEDGGQRRLEAGDWLVLPPHRRHRVAATSGDPACIWLCMFWT